MSPAQPTTGLESRCPSCGAPLRFGGAHSLAAVCAYCRSAVARHGVDLELIGKVPDLVATGSRLALGLGGRIGSSQFTVLGHLQLSRGGADDAAWDEWYCGFSDGTWGWLAEAQGRLHLTRPIELRAPSFPFEALYPGQRIDEPGIGVLAVEEVGSSRFVAAEGELPFSPTLGASYRFADLSAADGRFFTFDYGTPDDATADAQIFSGRRLGYDEAGLANRAPPTAAQRGGTVDEGEAIACPNCGASLSLKNPESVSITCPSCRSLLENGDRGPSILKKLASRENPRIPLGTRGEIDGESSEVLGWMRRSVVVDEVKYFWDEYLLHGRSGYRWLTEGMGQWHIVAPLDAGRVQPTPGVAAVVGDRKFKHFQSARARYEEIQGEFYWRVSTDHPVATADYVSPPFILSSETDAREENWSMGRWIAGDEVWRAFKLQGSPPPAPGVGAAQPNPAAEAGRGAWRVAGLALAAHLVSCVVMVGALPGEKVLSVDVPLTAASAPATPDPPPDPDGAFGPTPAPATPATPEPAVFVSDPFELSGARQAVEIKASAACEQSWVGLDTAIIEDASGESEAVGINLSYYHGYDDGESWSEGERSGSAVLGGLKRGRYVLRVEPQFGKELTGTLPASVHVEVQRGVFRAGPWAFVFFAILVWPIVLLFRRIGFEKRRWEESDHPMVQSS